MGTSEVVGGCPGARLVCAVVPRWCSTYSRQLRQPGEITPRGNWTRFPVLLLFHPTGDGDDFFPVVADEVTAWVVVQVGLALFIAAVALLLRARAATGAAGATPAVQPTPA
jgi:hypothetical protein